MNEDFVSSLLNYYYKKVCKPAKKEQMENKASIFHE